MIVSLFGRSARFKRLRIPFFLERVSAGFPSPAQDYVEQTLDLNELCVKHPAATFFVRVEGDSMVDAGIFTNDVLTVDRSLKAEHGDIVIACLEGDMKGLSDLYDKIIPRHCKQIARSWGLQVERHLLPIHPQRSTICKYSSGYTVIDNNAHPMTPPLIKNHARSYRIEREKIKSEEIHTYMLNPAIRAHLLERGIPIFGALK